jgi:hypothetical protein
MDKELMELMERSRSVHVTSEELEEGRIEIAAANGALNDDRITVATMKATRTIMLAAEREAR